MNRLLCRSHPDTVEEPVQTSLRTAAGVVAAAWAGDVARVVLLSSVGAEPRHGAGHIDGLARIEEHLDATGADVCHLRCGYFSSPTWPSTLTHWPGGADRVVQAVHGPEDLSYTRITQILTEALGRPIRLAIVSDDEVRDALRSAGVPPGAVEGSVGMTAGTRDLAPEQPRDLITTPHHARRLGICAPPPDACQPVTTGTLRDKAPVPQSGHAASTGKLAGQPSRCVQSRAEEG